MYYIPQTIRSDEGRYRCLIHSIAFSDFIQSPFAKVTIVPGALLVIVDVHEVCKELDNNISRSFAYVQICRT